MDDNEMYGYTKPSNDPEWDSAKREAFGQLIPVGAALLTGVMLLLSGNKTPAATNTNSVDAPPATPKITNVQVGQTSQAPAAMHVHKGDFSRG